MYNKIGIIGYGNMGSALAQRWKNDFGIFVFDKDNTKTQQAAGCKVVSSIKELIAASEVILLSVKPQDFDALFDEIKDFLGRKLIISIAAGITTEYIERGIGNCSIIRVMPNMAARIGKGMSCLCKGKVASADDLDFVKGLFSRAGEALVIDESMMDAATAVSGSGPGFFYDAIEHDDLSIDEIEGFAKNFFMPSFTASAEKVGFSPEQAKLLAQITAQGSVELLRTTKQSAAELKKQIVSKGGTTEAGLAVLHKGGRLDEAVKAAMDRSKELARR